jgi:Fic family protein
MYTPRYTITHAMLRSLSQISEAHALIMNAPLLPRWEAGLRRKALVQSVHSSTHLEGNPLTERQVADLLSGKDIPARHRDIQEVLNYKKLIDFVNESCRQTGRVIDTQIILYMHRICLGGIPEQEEFAGKYRTTQNYVVKFNSNGTQEIVYVPPRPLKVPILLSELVDWINKAEKEDVSPFIISGVAHYEFESIHPFVDGNGRTGRALVTLILYKMGYDTKRLFSLEEYYDQEPAGYYGTLRTIRYDYSKEPDPDLTPWLEYFVDGIAKEFKRIEHQVKEYLNAERMRKRLIQVELNSRQLKAMTHLQKHGSITNLKYQEKFGVSPATAKRELGEMAGKGLIRQIGETGRGVYYVISEPLSSPSLHTESYPSSSGKIESYGR